MNDSRRAEYLTDVARHAGAYKEAQRILAFHDEVCSEATKLLEMQNADPTLARHCQMALLGVRP
jgi:hypothetical protein